MKAGSSMYMNRKISMKKVMNPDQNAENSEEEDPSFDENKDEGCYLSMYQSVELPELNDNEYEAISSFKKRKNNPHLAIRDIKKQITAVIPRLEIHSNKTISLMFYKKRGIFWSTPPEFFEFFKSRQCQQEFIQLAIKPTKYLVNNCLPFNNSRKGVHWTLEKDNLLILIMQKADSSIIFLFFCFPGSTHSFP